MENSKRAGKTDGQTFRPEESDLVPGSVLRMVSEDGTFAPFSDFVVLAVRWVDKAGVRVNDSDADTAYDRREVVMARPYLYATLTCTTCPSKLLGSEELRVDVSRATGKDSPFRVVCTARGSLHGYTT